MAIIFELDEGSEYEGFKGIKRLPTSGGGEKYQHEQMIFSFEGKYYLSWRGMSGSYFTGFEKDDPEAREFSEVEENEITKTAWVYVETGKEI